MKMLDHPKRRFSILKARLNSEQYVQVGNITPEAEKKRLIFRGFHHIKVQAMRISPHILYYFNIFTYIKQI